MAVEEPEVGANIQFGDGQALVELTAIEAEPGDPVHHQHRRGRQLGVARPEIAALAGEDQVFLAVAGLGRVEGVRIGQGGAPSRGG